MGMDSLHLACAEAVKADYFITCDDDLLAKIKNIDDFQITVIKIMEFIIREVF